MPDEGVAVSQEEAPAAVRIEVPVDRLDFVYKAIAGKQEANSKESQDSFAHQNPATKKLTAVVQESYEAMARAMATEIQEVLNGSPEKGL